MFGFIISLYIRSRIKFKRRTHLQSTDNALYESVFVEIIQPNRKNINVGCFYRPPDASVTGFDKALESILTTISFENK